MAKNTTWDHHLTLVLSRLMSCNRLLDVHEKTCSVSFVHWQGQMTVCDSPSTLTDTMSTLDSKGVALTKESMVIFSSWTSWTWTFNHIACSIEIVCCPNANSDIISLERDHLALLEANCWFIYALASQQKSNIAKCCSDKVEQACFNPF